MFIPRIIRSFYKREWNKSENCDVLIIVEHTVRELETAIYLARELEKKGLIIAVDSPKWNINRLPELYRAKCVLVPWVYDSREMSVWRNFKDLNDNKSIIINFHHEQITGSNSTKFILPNNESKNTYHICWGTDYYHNIENLVPDNSRILCGSPRLELTKLHQDISDNDLINQYQLGEFKRILYLSNSFHLQKASERDFFETRGVSLKEISKSGISNTIYALESFDRLLKTNNDLQIIYRPHPSMIEREQKFDLLQNLNSRYKDRFRIIGEKSVHHWIKISDAVLTFHSTCFAESYVLEKPFALFRFQEMPESDEPDIFKFVEKVTTYNELENFIINPKFYKVPDFDRFYFNKKVNSFDVLINFIHDSLNGLHPALHHNPTRYDRLKNYIIFILKFILNRLGQVKKIRRFFLDRKDYRINNFAWMSGSDAYNTKDIEEYKRLYK